MATNRLDKSADDYSQIVSSITDRVRHLIHISRMPQGKFAQRIGMDAANFSKVLSGNLKMSDAFINRIVVELGVSKQWLLYGEGVPFEKSTDKDVPEIFVTPHIVKKPVTGTPVYDIDVTAGFEELSQMFTADKVIGYMDFPRLNRDSVMVRVSGDSMIPAINDGALIAIHRVQPDGIICWGQIYVVVLDDYRMVKYVRKNADANKVTLHSANNEYDDMEIKRSDIRELFVVDAILNYKLL